MPLQDANPTPSFGGFGLMLYSTYSSFQLGDILSVWYALPPAIYCNAYYIATAHAATMRRAPPELIREERGT